MLKYFSNFWAMLSFRWLGLRLLLPFALNLRSLGCNLFRHDFCRAIRVSGWFARVAANAFLLLVLGLLRNRAPLLQNHFQIPA